MQRDNRGQAIFPVCLSAWRRCSGRRTSLWTTFSKPAPCFLAFPVCLTVAVCFRCVVFVVGSFAVFFAVGFSLWVFGEIAGLFCFNSCLLCIVGVYLGIFYVLKFFFWCCYLFWGSFYEPPELLNCFLQRLKYRLCLISDLGEAGDPHFSAGNIRNTGCFAYEENHKNTCPSLYVDPAPPPRINSAIVARIHAIIRSKEDHLFLFSCCIQHVCHVDRER